MSPSVVVTAAHVTDISGAWGQVVSPVRWHIEIIPGLAAEQRPFNSFWAGSVVSHPSWTGRATTDHDIAVIKIAAIDGTPAFPRELCLRPVADGVTAAAMPVVEVAGYPHIVDSTGGTPVRGSGPVRVVEGPLCFYDVDTEDGQSGGPVFGGPSGAAARTVVAIHSGGQGNGLSSEANGLNAGLRLRPELVSWLGTH